MAIVLPWNGGNAAGSSEASSASNLSSVAQDRADASSTPLPAVHVPATTATNTDPPTTKVDTSTPSTTGATKANEARKSDAKPAPTTTSTASAPPEKKIPYPTYRDKEKVAVGDRSGLVIRGPPGSKPPVEPSASEAEHKVPGSTSSTSNATSAGSSKTASKPAQPNQPIETVNTTNAPPASKPAETTEANSHRQGSRTNESTDRRESSNRSSQRDRRSPESLGKVYNHRKEDDRTTADRPDSQLPTTAQKSFNIASFDILELAHKKFYDATRLPKDTLVFLWENPKHICPIDAEFGWEARKAVFEEFARRECITMNFNIPPSDQQHGEATSRTSTLRTETETPSPGQYPNPTGRNGFGTEHARGGDNNGSVGEGPRLKVIEDTIRRMLSRLNHVFFNFNGSECSESGSFWESLALEWKAELDKAANISDSGSASSIGKEVGATLLRVVNESAEGTEAETSLRQQLGADFSTTEFAVIRFITKRRIEDMVKTVKSMVAGGLDPEDASPHWKDLNLGSFDNYVSTEVKIELKRVGVIVSSDIPLDTSLNNKPPSISPHGERRAQPIEEPVRQHTEDRRNTSTAAMRPQQNHSESSYSHWRVQSELPNPLAQSHSQYCAQTPNPRTPINNYVAVTSTSPHGFGTTHIASPTSASSRFASSVGPVHYSPGNTSAGIYHLTSHQERYYYVQPEALPRSEPRGASTQQRPRRGAEGHWHGSTRCPTTDCNGRSSSQAYR